MKTELLQSNLIEAATISNSPVTQINSNNFLEWPGKPEDRSAGQAIDDGLATSRIKAAIAEADLGDGLKINVDTYHGKVLLTGFVDTPGHKDQAGEIAAKDKNTRDVINGIYVLN